MSINRKRFTLYEESSMPEREIESDRNQKMIFRANWVCRELVAVAVSAPADAIAGPTNAGAGAAAEGAVAAEKSWVAAFSGFA